MANQLTDLVVKEISFCKKGAQPGATVSIFKSADPVPEPVPVINEDSIITKLAKQFGLVAKTEPVVPEVVNKSLFTDAWTAKELRSNFYDAFWTLDDVCWQIMNDETISDKAGAIATACAEFASLMPTLMGSESIAKCMEVRKTLFEPAKAQIQKALAVEKSDEEEIEMTPEEKAALINEVTKSVTETITGSLSDVITKAIATAVEPLQAGIAKAQTEIETIGKAAGTSQQAPGQDKPEPVEKSANLWDGVI